MSGDLRGVAASGATRINFDADLPCASGFRPAHGVVVTAVLCPDDDGPWWHVESVVLSRRGRRREVRGVVAKSTLRALGRAAALEYATCVDELRAAARAGRGES